MQSAKRPRQALRVLVVQQDVQLGEAFRDALRAWGAKADWVGTLSAGIAACEQPFDFLVLDSHLSDGSGVKLAELAARLRPAPLVVAVTSPSAAREAFRMAQLGAVAHLQKPVTGLDVTVAIEQAMAREPEFLPHLVPVVGRAAFREVLDRTRRAMAEQALAMSAGNKTGAARLLGITRQAVQQLIRDLELSDGSQRPHLES